MLRSSSSTASFASIRSNRSVASAATRARRVGRANSHVHRAAAAYLPPANISTNDDDPPEREISPEPINNLDSIAPDDLHDIFVARCKDTGDLPSEDKARLWRQNLAPRNTTPGLFDFRTSRVGIAASGALVKALKGVEAIEELDVYGCWIRDGGVANLCQLVRWNPAIRALNLGSNDLHNRSAALLGELLAEEACELEALELGREPGDQFHVNHLDGNAGGDLARALAVNTTLKELNCYGNDFGIVPKDPVEAMAEADPSSSLAIIKDLMKYESKLAGDHVTKQGPLPPSKLWAQAIAANHTLISLNLGGNRLDSWFVFDMLEALTVNSTLAHLYLQNNLVKSDLGIAMGEMLESNMGLRTLILAGNDLGEEGGTSIGEALKVNGTLTHLDLEGSSIGDRGAAVIADALRVNSSLTHLNLSKCSIGEEGMAALGQGLAANRSVVVFKASGNAAKAAGASAFAGAMSTRSCRLTNIDLSSCKISDAGALEIVEALSSNTRVTTLKLVDNFISAPGGQAMVEGLGANSTLISLDVRGNQIDHTDVLNMKNIGKRNRSEAKKAVVAPLKAEITRLKSEKDLLPKATAELAAAVEEREAAQAQINVFEAKLAMLKSDEALAVEHLQRALATQSDAMTAARQKLADKDADILAIDRSYDLKIQGVMQDRDLARAKKATVQALLNGKRDELVRRKAEHTEAMTDMRKNIDDTSARAADLRAKAAAAEAELEELNKLKRAHLMKLAKSNANKSAAPTPRTPKKTSEASPKPSPRLSNSGATPASPSAGQWRPGGAPRRVL